MEKAPVNPPKGYRTEARIAEIKALFVRPPVGRPKRYRANAEHARQYQALRNYIGKRIYGKNFRKDIRQIFPIIKECYKFTFQNLPHYRDRLMTKDEMMEALRKFINIFKPKNGK